MADSELLWKLKKVREEVEREARRIAKKKQEEAEDLAPLIELGFARAMPWPTCGHRTLQPNIQDQPEARWPAEVSEAVKQVRAVDGVEHATVGPRYTRCDQCRSAWPGVCVWVSRIVTRNGWNRVSAGRVFPKAELLEAPVCA